MHIEVKGLKQCLTNLHTLLHDMQTKIVNDSLREAMWKLAEPMRSATYTTFTRRTGAIKKGLSVAVQHDFHANKLTGYVVEYPQDIAGSTPFATLFRKHLKLKGTKHKGQGRSVETRATAYWWIMLEKGTQPRRATRTPNFIRQGRPMSANPKRQARQVASLKKWQASPSRGGIRSRRWLQPIADATTPAAIDTFRAVLFAEMEKHINDYPKKE